MEKYSEQIVKAYNNWMNKIDAEPIDEWNDGYKNKRIASKRAGDKFEKLCIEAGLNYVKVASDLCPNVIISIS